MLRYAACVWFACVPLLALAAPIPKESDAARMKRIYGETIDPDKDCTFELTGEKLRIAIPDKHHSLNKKPGLNNAPRTAKEIVGDFTVVVRVSFPIRALEGLKANEDRNCFACGGLVVWSEDDETLRLTRREFRLGQRQMEGFMRDWNSPKKGGDVYLAPVAKKTEAAYLRIERKGQKVQGDWSYDQKKWSSSTEIEVGWGEKVKVGVIAENNYGVPFEATFDEYKLTQPKQ